MSKKLVKSVYLDDSEKRLCKLAGLDFGIKLKVFYNDAIRWFLGQYEHFPFIFANKESSSVISVWLTEENREDLEKIDVPAAHFIHTAILLYLESHGYLKDTMSIEWPNKEL